MTNLLPEREVVRRRIERESTVRGMLLGLALVDAIEAGPNHGSSGWRGSATTQLACFITEGLIRASVRGAAEDICHPPEVMWHALARWSEQQRMGLPVAKRWRGGTDKHWPDGWLASIDAEGEVKAAAGCGDAARRAFDEADVLLPADPQEPDLPFLFLADGHLDRWRGHVLARLGEPEAATHVATALGQIPADFVRSRSSALTDLAYAHVARGEREAARLNVQEARCLAMQVNSNRQLRRLDAQSLPF